MLVVMSLKTKIRVDRRDSRFSAAHFLADMGKCERLHGHNYFVAVEAQGQPDERGVVLDFNLLEPAIAAACAPLDHKVLIAGNSPSIQLRENGAELEIGFKQKRYVMPKEDCVILPLSSTSVESLSGYLLEKILERLGPAGARLEWIEVGVSEGGTQTAYTKKDF